MQAVAAEFSGYAGLFCCSFFWRERVETVCFGPFILKLALKWAWSAYLRAL
jgi:hypothetical protein